MFALAVIGTVLAAGGFAYAVFGGERARQQMNQQQADAANQVRTQRASDEERLRQERIQSQQALFDQEAKQKALEVDLQKQQADALTTAKAAVPGIQSQLGNDLLAQQNRAYQSMDPQIEARLNALGLLQSGALVDAKSKAYGDLESQRQAALAQFGTNAAQQLSITQPLANSSGDIQRQSQYLNNNLQTSQNNLSQQFASAAQNAQNNVAQDQYLAGLRSAQIQSQQATASSYMHGAATLGSGLMGYAASRPSTPTQNTSLDALYSVRTPGWTTPSKLNYYGSYK